MVSESDRLKREALRYSSEWDDTKSDDSVSDSQDEDSFDEDAPFEFDNGTLMNIVQAVIVLSVYFWIFFSIWPDIKATLIGG